MGYFLIVDKEVIKYSSDFDIVLKTLADMYGGRTSIEYYGLITKDDILSMEYMDIHEGCSFFISCLKLIDFENKTKKDISINIYSSGYLMEYVDDEDEDGYVIIDWLKAHKNRYYLDYSESGIKRYCIMVDENFVDSYDTLEEAFDHLKKDKEYGNLAIAVPEDKFHLKDTDLSYLKDDEGYHTFLCDISSLDGTKKYDITIVEMDSVFDHFHRPNARALAWYLDRDRSKYEIIIF